MSEVERVLLENALDSLDRLFDSKSGIVDTYALMYATAQALAGSQFSRHFSIAAVQLEGILRSHQSREEARERALDATNELRIKIADALPHPLLNTLGS